MSLERPELSVIVVMVGDTLSGRAGTEGLTETLTALANQQRPPAMEILVPYRAGGVEMHSLAERFPKVQFVPAIDLKFWNGQAGREHHDELRARAAALATGRILAFLEDHVSPDSLWSARVVAHHRSRRYSVIGGAIENDIRRPLNWAAYFCDLGRYANPVPEGESAFASTVNNSYKREALDAVAGVWSERFNETRVNAEIRRRGMKIALSPDIVVLQRRRNLRLRVALGEFFVWGRSYASNRSEHLSGARRLLYMLLSPVLPALFLGRMGRNVIARRRHVGAFLGSLPFSLLLTASWSLGELAGYRSAKPRPSPARVYGRAAGC